MVLTTHPVFVDLRLADTLVFLLHIPSSDCSLGTVVHFAMYWTDNYLRLT